MGQGLEVSCIDDVTGLLSHFIVKFTQPELSQAIASARLARAGFKLPSCQAVPDQDGCKDIDPVSMPCCFSPCFSD
jgi:hypothetical protein